MYSILHCSHEVRLMKWSIYKDVPRLHHALCTYLQFGQLDKARADMIDEPKTQGKQRKSL